ncbi:uncharacterized protein BO80DRAFT_443655 [Aspergillus ibericus CBS 121593]|uniref:DUF7729 domain-containing protein n=1 Tax=Aspergillus ibericus CBS 121593 TaxID=1448316 RepID=A0A395H803_9EURO|nr:hypothetical protein BO80DRAFT_443655 [Aspergillus ibericus CBS 121593]RAL02344.1 hypothetical protein BO80DRAFT_443655 [Aspergillus ibericus CBS 121593]
MRVRGSARFSLLFVWSLFILLALPSISASVLPIQPVLQSNSEISPDSGETLVDPSPHTISILDPSPPSPSPPTNLTTTTTPTTNPLHPRATSTDTPTDTTFPTPFDTSLTNNFTTTTCAKYFTTLLTNTTLTTCHPISLLLRNSASFFTTLTTPTHLSTILDTACAAPLTTCSTTLTTLATTLLHPTTCGHDYTAGNQLVIDLYTDLLTYEPLYRATCLQSPTTKNYCFVDAVTNTSNAVNYDVYFVAYGTGYEVTEAPWPTCDVCLQATMGVFAQWAGVDGQPLVESYLPTARALDGEGACGTGFVDVNVTVGEVKRVEESGGFSFRCRGRWGVMGWSLGVGLLVGAGLF